MASSLSTLPFRVLRILFQGSERLPQETLAVHRAAMEVGAIQMVLLCLAVLSHHKPRATSHSHKLALQALSALTGRYMKICYIVHQNRFFFGRAAPYLSCIYKLQVVIILSELIIAL